MRRLVLTIILVTATLAFSPPAQAEEAPVLLVTSIPKTGRIVVADDGQQVVKFRVGVKCSAGHSAWLDLIVEQPLSGSAAYTGDDKSDRTFACTGRSQRISVQVPPPVSSPPLSSGEAILSVYLGSCSETVEGFCWGEVYDDNAVRLR